MVARDRTCTFPYCIKLATPAPCQKCSNWLCTDHLKTHDCTKVDTWHTSTAMLNALKPDQVKVDKAGKIVRVKLRSDTKGPSRKSWHDIIDR